MPIPKIIFQTWKSKTEMSDSFRFWSTTLKVHNPDYVYRLWDDANNRAFISNNYPWFLPTYDAFPREIYRADAVRYFFLYEYGGVYADMDMQCLAPLDPILGQGGVTLGRMGADPNFEHSVPNAWMASEPREEFWLFVISMMITADPTQRPEYVTGPVILKKAMDAYTQDYTEDYVQNRLGEMRVRLTEAQQAKPHKSKITVLPPHVIFPLDWSDPVHDEFVRKPLLREGKVLEQEQAQRFFPKSTMLTLWSHTWEPQNLG